MLDKSVCTQRAEWRSLARSEPHHEKKPASSQCQCSCHGLLCWFFHMEIAFTNLSLCVRVCAHDCCVDCFASSSLRWWMLCWFAINTTIISTIECVLFMLCWFAINTTIMTTTWRTRLSDWCVDCFFKFVVIMVGLFLLRSFRDKQENLEWP